MSDGDDLFRFGWAPGFYCFRCRDCTPAENVRPLDWPLGAKRSWRCKPCAEKAKEDFARDSFDPLTEMRA